MKQDTSIAVISSDDDTLKVLSEALGEKCTIVTYRTFDEAEGKLKDLKAPDLVVLDLHLEDTSVWSACSRIKSGEMKKARMVPLLAVSSILSEADFDHCFKTLSVNGFASLLDNSLHFLKQVEALLTTHVALPESLVLIVDDDRNVVQFFSRSISFRGHAVLQAYNISSALRIIRNKRPDIVLLDHRLEGESGFALIAGMKKEGLCSIIIVVTGDPSPGLAREYSRLGADAFASKPIEPSYLALLINNAYSQRSKSCVEKLLLQKMKKMQSDIV